MVQNGINAVGMTMLDKEGKFTITDTAENPRFLFLRQSGKYISLLVLNGQKLSISGDLEDINGTFRISGSRESELMWELNQEMQAAAIELDSLAKIYNQLREKTNNQEADDWFSRKYQELLSDQKDFIRIFINQNFDSPASLMALSHQLGNQPVLNREADFAYFAKVDSSLSEQYPNSNMVKTLHNWVLGQKQQKNFQEAESKNVGIGSEAPEIVLNNPDGEAVSLSSFKGKFVLLDFWAAWCSPCRRENPNLVRAYKLFNDKGFEIFQVSLDRTKEEWVGAIKNDNLNWTQVSDLKYWSSPAAKLYYVRSIPANFLIDPNGIIIAKNLRGSALEEKLHEVLNK
jgi:peroxiredoxin